MNTHIRKQQGVTIVELLVVVAILGILGGLTGLFLMKYLPDYRLQSAVSGITQNLRYAQSNSIKVMRPYYIEFNIAAQRYDVRDSGPDQTVNTADDTNIKRVELSTYGSGVQFNSGASGETIISGLSAGRAIFNPEGTVTTSGAIRLNNNAGTTYRINILQTGSIRSLRWEGMWK